MKLINLKLEHIIILALFVLLFMNNLTPKKRTENIEKVVYDTTYITKIDSLSKLFKSYKNMKPQIVYVKVKDDKIERITKQEAIIENTKELAPSVIELNEFKDTLSNREVTIFSTVLTDGKIYQSDIKYELKYPVIEKTLSPNKKNKSGLFLYSGIGGNKTQLDNLEIGLQYIHQNKWLVGYGINTLANGKPTHQLKFGIKIF